jgi:hypothetical protein
VKYWKREDKKRVLRYLEKSFFLLYICAGIRIQRIMTESMPSVLYLMSLPFQAERGPYLLSVNLKEKGGRNLMEEK